MILKLRDKHNSRATRMGAYAVERPARAVGLRGGVDHVAETVAGGISAAWGFERASIDPCPKQCDLRKSANTVQMYRRSFASRSPH